MQLSAYIDPDEEPLPVQAFPEPYIDKVTKQQPQNKKNNSQHLLCQTKWTKCKQNKGMDNFNFKKKSKWNRLCLVYWCWPVLFLMQ